MKETLKEKASRLKKILKKLKQVYPDAHCALHHENPFQLLVATILSAQCTDARVNKVTPLLFKELPKPQAFAKADIKKIEELIRSTGFYKNKARNIKSCSQSIVERFHGHVPKTMEELTSLAGVGRKTANVILGNAYGIPGLVVDTHVTRLSNRMGFVKGQNAVRIEQDLMEITPKHDWTQLSHLFITHGRQICAARSPKCRQCIINKLCPKFGVNERY